MKGGIVLIIALILVSLISISSAYEITYYQKDTGSNTDIRHGFQFDDYTGCNITAISYYDNSTATMQTRFYDPYSTFQYYTSNDAETGNCLFSGAYEWIADALTSEFRVTSDYVTNAHMEYVISCPERQDFIYINASGNDSDSYVNNVFCADSALNMSTANFYLCGSSWGRCPKTGLPSSTRSFAIPFIAGYNNTEIYVRLTSSFGNVLEDHYVYVYPINDTSSPAFINVSIDTAYSNFILNETLTNLEYSREYVFILIFNKGTGTYDKTLQQMYVKTFDYNPVITCSEWSTCNNVTNKQKRLCSDELSLIEQYYEFRNCVSATGDYDDYAIIGFRNLTSYNVPVCIPDWTLTGCTNYVVNKTVYMPYNWELVSSETLGNHLAGQYPYRAQSWVDLEGFKFMLWNRPPKPNEAYYNYSGTDAWECINQTGFSPSWEVKNISNTTMSAEFNITFPDNNMQMWFTVKKCDEQQHQYTHEDTSSWFGVNCGELCYSGSCSDEVRGNYRFDIYDLTDNEEILRYDGIAINEWRKYYIDLSDANLEAGNSYRIQVSAYDPDFTTKGTCLEFWDLGYGISSGEFECESYCDYDTFHFFDAITNPDGICIFEDKGISEQCINNEYLVYVNSCKNYCDKNNNYHIGDNTSGICYWKAISNADVCQDKISPETTLIPSNLAQTLNGYGLGIVNFLVSISSFIYISLAIICFMTAKWFAPNAFIGIIFIVMLLANGGYIPSFLLAIIAIASFILFARSTVNILTGGTNQG